MKSPFLPLLLSLSAYLYSHLSVPDIPPHLLDHRIHFEPEMLDSKLRENLMKLVKEMGYYPSNAADLKFYKTLREDIGEAVPIESDGTCKLVSMIPSINRTLCVFPGRLDVAQHFLRKGGVEARRESFDVLSSRLQSFGRYIFNITDYPVAEELFKSGKFQNAAKTICPFDRQHLDPFQFNFIIQVPGQTVAMHLDGPYFWGASRFEFPQWLLAVMVFSGLFKERFVNQVQVVGYLHEWRDRLPERKGEFIVWNEPKAKIFSPISGAGISVDGSKTIHAASIYFPNTIPPFLPTSKLVALHYDSSVDTWHLKADDEVLKSYSTDDLRISIVYRARCFKDETEAWEFKHQNKEDALSLETILDRLKGDLISKGRLSPLKTLSAYELGLLLLREYAAYPPPLEKVFFPLNYCALPMLYPSTQHFLRYICD